MKVRIVVGDVEIRTDGLDLTKADVTRLLTRAADIAAERPVAVEHGRNDPTDSRDTDASVTLSAGDVPHLGFTPFSTSNPWPDEE